MNDKIIKKLDIRGKICPMTYVYTKISLEKMVTGEILEILLDFPAAVKNIPSSAKTQGLAKHLDAIPLNPEKKEWLLRLERL